MQIGHGLKIELKNKTVVGKDVVSDRISSHERPSLGIERIDYLVELAQNGDADSFGVIYDHFADQIYRYVYFRVPRSEAEDITEMVFLKAWEKLKQYAPRKRSFSAWLFRIAHNLIVDTYRLKKDSEVEELVPDVPEYRREHNPVKMAERTLDSDALKVALSKLTGKHRQVIILKFINELSNEEVAQIMKKTEGGIRILQFRALKSLKRELSDSGFNLSM